MRKIGIASYAIVIATVMTPSQAPAQDEVILFRCHFDWKCDPNRKCDHADLQRAIKMRTATNEAEVLGGNPLDKVQVSIGDRAVSFLEHQISGAVDVTTVKLMNGESVYATHRIDGVTLNPAQYLGECVGLPASE